MTTAPAGLPTASQGLSEHGHDPDATGHFGPYGGRFMPEALIAAARRAGRGVRQGPRTTRSSSPSSTGCCATTPAGPAPLTDARRLTEHAGGARILLKREDLNHTGSHKINNVLGQALLTKRMGKTRVIAETGAGQHGVATATAAALLGLDCIVYMGEVDTERQALNVARMRLLGAEVVPVDHRLAHPQGRHQRGLSATGSPTSSTPTTSSARSAGPHPFPTMVRDFQRVIGVEARAQCLELDGRLPDAVAACVGGGSNAIGIFHAFLDDDVVRLFGFEAGGDGVETGRHAATDHRRQRPACCTAPDLPAAGRGRPDRSSRTRSRPASTTRASGPSTPTCTTSAAPTYRPVTDAEAMDAFALLCRTEGIIPAIESAHAVAGALRLGQELGPDAIDPGQPLRPRRQGHGHRRALVRLVDRT